MTSSPKSIRVNRQSRRSSAKTALRRRLCVEQLDKRELMDGTGSTLNFSESTTVTNSAIVDTLGFTKTGSGILTLSGQNSYSGSLNVLNVSSGSLFLGVGQLGGGTIGEFTKDLKSLSTLSLGTDANGGGATVLAYNLVENTPAGTLIGEFGRSAFENGPAGNTNWFNVRFELVSGEGDSDNGLFRLYDHQIAVIAPIAFDTKPKVSIRVRITTADGVLIEKAIKLDVKQDINKAPTGTSIKTSSLTPLSVAENSSGEVIGVFQSEDPNAYERFSYQLADGIGDTGNANFLVLDNMLVANRPIDFETTPEQPVRIRTSDRRGAFREDVFVVAVRDVYDGPLGPGDYDPSFGENGVVLTTSSVPDAIPTEAGVEIKGGNNSDLNLFTLIQPDGKIVVNTVLNIARYLPDGLLDESFGDGGRISAPINVRSLSLQSDGKIVAIGDRKRNEVSSAAIARFHADGTLDQDFADNGWRYLPGYSEKVDFGKLRVVIRSNGDLIVSGRVVQDASDPVGFVSLISLNSSALPPASSLFPKSATSILLTQLSANGDIDTSFGSEGFVTSEDYSFVHDLIEDPEGRLLILADRYNPLAEPAQNIDELSRGIFRLASDGSIDTTFGDNGFAFTGGAQDFILLPDGKIRTVSLEVRVSENSVPVSSNGLVFVDARDIVRSIATLQFNERGERDQAFGTDGRQRVQLESDFYQRVYFQPDAKIVLRGVENGLSGTEFGRYLYSLRYNEDLTLDTSYLFNSGALTKSLDWLVPSQDLAIDNQGRTFWLDAVQTKSSDQGISNLTATLHRFNSDGTKDLGFGENGSINLVEKPSDDGVAKVLGLADGSILLVGNHGGNPVFGNLGLTKFKPDGTLDFSFGTGGRVTQKLHDRDSFVVDAALQQDGKIVVAGSIKVNDTWDFVVSRYLLDGSLDTGFGNDGIAMVDVGNSDNLLEDLEIEMDGSILVAGRTRSLNPRSVLLRLREDGTLETTFDLQDEAIADQYFENGIYQHAFQTKIALQGENILVLRSVSVLEEGLKLHHYLSRFHKDGSLDQSFNNGRSIQLNLTGTKTVTRLDSIQVREDGKILLGGPQEGASVEHGYFEYGGVYVGFDQDGFIDESFGNDGVVETGVISETEIDSNGKIYSLGLYGITRFNSDGSLDLTYGNAGMVSHQFGESERLDVLENGDVVFAGRSDRFGTPAVFVAKTVAGTPRFLPKNEVYTLPANGAVYALDGLGTTTSAATDDGLVANDTLYSGAQVRVEVSREPRYGKLEIAQDGSFTYIPNRDVEPDTEDSFSYRLRDAFDRLSDEATATFRFTEKGDLPLHNKRLKYDVDQDGEVTPLDALKVLNAVSRVRGEIDSRSRLFRSDLMVDVNGDLLVTPLDALQVINSIRRRGRSEASAGESLIDAVFASSVDLDDVLEKRKRQSLGL